MRRIIEEATKSPTAKDLYALVTSEIEAIEDDTYDLEVIMLLLSQYRKFLETNFTLS